MYMTKTRRLVLSGLLVALGIVLPYFTAHMFAIPGTILLPMHIPVLLCGLLCGRYSGAMCGLLIPLLSSLLTGMPAFYPMLPIMAVQLFVMGLVCGQLYNGKTRWNTYLALLLSMIAGWVAYGLMFALLMVVSNGNLRALSVSAALLKGMPGIAIQLLLLPIIINSLKKPIGRRMHTMTTGCKEKALQLVQSGTESCIVIQNNEIVYATSGRGVSPLLKLYETEPEKLNGSIVVDKIIGKAAAMILVLGGASEVYGEVMSASAQQYLKDKNINIAYGRCVDVISNRDKNGICPIERSVLDIDDPSEGVAHITNTIRRLMAKAAG